MNISKRLLSQLAFFIAQNPLLKNFFTGTIYQGNAKRVCTPGLNCYSCPAAITSCPMGAMQLFLAGAKHNVGLFVVGFLLTIGVIFGRFICGYLCPMGLLQDLIYKIPTLKLKLKLRFLRYGKYVVLALFVIVLPLLVLNEFSGLGAPWFCKYICPVGTIFAATPILVFNEGLRSIAGGLFIWKAALAAAIIIVSVIVYRFFCRVICPLGAVYALFNKIALVKMKCDNSRCNSCGVCARTCNICLTPSIQPNSPECVRCGDCVKKCHNGALEYDFFVSMKKDEKFEKNS